MEKCIPVTAFVLFEEFDNDMKKDAFYVKNI